MCFWKVLVPATASGVKCIILFDMLEQNMQMTAERSIEELGRAEDPTIITCCCHKVHPDRGLALAESSHDS